MTFEFIEYRDGRNSFDLECPVCGSSGELGLRPDYRNLVECPNRCGALFMQRRSKAFFGHPVLEYVAGGQIQVLNPGI